MNPHFDSRAHVGARQLIAYLCLAPLVAAATTVTFNYSGAEQNFVVPQGVAAVHVVARGASGWSGVQGGLGGSTSGDLAVAPGSTLYIYVGGQGTAAIGTSASGGGFNGGGHGKGNGTANTAGGGGGASDVRSGGNALSNRVIVAAGGGASTSAANSQGGAGGGLSGNNGAPGSGGMAGGGGTQSFGGAGLLFGGFGVGGSATAGSTALNGGGGGGWYGGGASLNAGGGGGSSYTAGAGVTNGFTTSGVRGGDGDVVLTFTQAKPNDFNTDGKPDLLWSHTTSGATYVWYMNGPALISDAFIATIDPSWKVRGVGDFNGDGKPDLVWRNTANGNTYVWYMNGPSFLSDAFVFSLPPEWVIQGVADFNGDGKPDFLMRNTNTGVAFAWFFDNNVAIGDQFLFGIDPSWKVEQVGDMDGDAQPDLLFRNVSSGLAFAWYTQFTGGILSLAGSSPSIFSIDPAWEIVQLEDWNADGNPDLLFRNRNTGVVFVWYMSSATLQGSDFIIQIDPSWEIVPRRADPVVLEPLVVTVTPSGGGTVTSAPAGINCGVDCSENYAHGTVVTLSASPGAGATFNGWSGACSGTGTCIVTMDAARSVSADFALTACASPSPGNVGCEFYAVPMSNTILDRGTFSFGVALLNPGTSVATVTISGGALPTPGVYNIAAGDPLTVLLPWIETLQNTSATVRQDNGAYRIVSDRPLAAYQFNPMQYASGGQFSFSNDASLLLPVSALTGNYRVVSWPSWLNQAGMFAIVATQDATSVTVSPSVTIVAGGGLSGSGGSVTLHRGDVLQVAVPTPGTMSYGSDPSGSLVVADHPVAVFSAHDATFIPASDGYADHLEEQLPPLETLGSDMIVPLLKTQTGNPRKQFVKLVGTQDGTTITYDPAVPGAPSALNAGQVVSFEATFHFRLAAVHPVLVAQFMEGGSLFPDGGDPSMGLVVPFTQFRNQHAFIAPTDFLVNRLTVVAPTGAAVNLDGVPISPANFVAMGASGYSIADIVLSSGNSGAHRVTSAASVGITVYGYGDNTSYLYPGGMDLAR